ncbi:MAG TPA: NAD(P)-binding protein, partial [Thermoanaerobaculia bacterium]
MAKKRVAILGGGCGAMAAAYYLSNTPHLREHLEVTVYQLGWRLGGKGASGRNAAYHDRIEEHGLHVWGGFYYNAFHMVQDVFGELNRPPDCPLRTWTDTFEKYP